MTGVDRNHGYAPIILPSQSDNCLINCKIKMARNGGYGYYLDMGLGKWNKSNNLAGLHYVRNGEIGLNGMGRYSESNSAGNNHIIEKLGGPSYSLGTWYYIELEIRNGVDTVFKVYDENKTNLLYSHTVTMNTNISGGDLVIVGQWQQGIMYFKDVKIEPL